MAKETTESTLAPSFGMPPDPLAVAPLQVPEVVFAPGASFVVAQLLALQAPEASEYGVAAPTRPLRFADAARRQRLLVPGSTVSRSSYASVQVQKTSTPKTLRTDRYLPYVLPDQNFS